MASRAPALGCRRQSKPIDGELLRRTTIYRVMWAVGPRMDVTILELPIVHLFVPDQQHVLDGARLLIARTWRSIRNRLTWRLPSPTETRRTSRVVAASDRSLEW